MSNYSSKHVNTNHLHNEKDYRMVGYTHWMAASANILAMIVEPWSDGCSPSRVTHPVCRTDK